MEYTAQVYVANQNDTYASIAARFGVQLSVFLDYNCLSGNEGIFGFEKFLIPSGNWRKHKHVIYYLNRLFKKKCCKLSLIKLVDYCEGDVVVPLVALVGVKKHKLISRKLLVAMSLPGFTACELYPLAALEECFGSCLNCSCLAQEAPCNPGCNNILGALGVCCCQAPCGCQGMAQAPCGCQGPTGCYQPNPYAAVVSGATGCYQIVAPCGPCNAPCGPCNPCNAPCGPCNPCNVPSNPCNAPCGPFNPCNVPCNVPCNPCNAPCGPTWNQLNCCNEAPYQGLLSKILGAC